MAYCEWVVSRLRSTAMVVTTGATTTLIGTLLPWLRSGSENRSSFELAELAGRLGFVSGGLHEWILRCWAFMPLLLVLGVVAQWRGPESSPIVRIFLPAIAGVVSVLTALVVWSAPDVHLFGTGVGPVVTVAGAAMMLFGAGRLAVEARARATVHVG